MKQVLICWLSSWDLTKLLILWVEASLDLHFYDNSPGLSRSILDTDWISQSPVQVSKSAGLYEGKHMYIKYIFQTSFDCFWHFEGKEFDIWRLQWKKGGRLFTQNWTLSETLQISHVVLIRCVKECSACFLAEVCLVFEILRMQKTCILWSRQHVTAKTVISLKIKQNIDLLQRATLKSVHFR